MSKIYGEFEKPIYNPGFSSLTSLFSAVNENSELNNVECVKDVVRFEMIVKCTPNYL